MQRHMYIIDYNSDLMEVNGISLYLYLLGFTGIHWDLMGMACHQPLNCDLS